MVPYFEEMLSGVPEEYRDKAVLEVTDEDNYEYSELKVWAYYDHVETDAEYAQRKDEERRSIARQVADREARERATYLALKAKYEPTKRGA